MTELHLFTANRTRRLPIEALSVLLFVERKLFCRSRIITLRVTRTAEEITILRPDLLQILSTLRTLKLRHDLWNKSLFFSRLHRRNELFPKTADHLFPLFLPIRNHFKRVFHGCCKANIHNDFE